MANEELRAAVMTVSTRRRAGLGRGLDAALAGVEGESLPAHVQPLHDTGLRVSVEERASGTTVTVFDARGRSASVQGDWSPAGMRSAAVHAVAELAGVELESVVLDQRTLDDTPVLTMLLVTTDADRFAGAAVVAGTETFAAVEAAAAALGIGAP